MSRFKDWLDEVDPYTIQRSAFRKGLFIATIMVYSYWIFLPVDYLSFILPLFILSIYEMPTLSSFKKKRQLLMFIYSAVLFVSVSFYLVFPFRGTFFFFCLAVLAGLYFFVLRYFYALKNLVLMSMAIGTIILSTEPEANLQIAYGFISSILLSCIIVIVCLRIYPHQYLRIWKRALEHFIQYFEQDIENALREDRYKIIMEEIVHFEMVRNYQRLVDKKYFLTCFRIAVYIRNIQLSLDNLYYEKKNDLFWSSVKENLHRLRLNMKDYTLCEAPQFNFEPETKLQHYVADCLKRAFIHWNVLCKLRYS